MCVCVCLCIYIHVVARTFVQEHFVVRLWEVARFDFLLLATRSSQMNAEAANDVDPIC